MKKVIVKYGQSLYDLGVQLYGHTDGAWIIIKDNPQFDFSITDVPVPGMVLNIRKTIPALSRTNQRIAAEMVAQGIEVASGIPATYFPPVPQGLFVIGAELMAGDVLGDGNGNLLGDGNGDVIGNGKRLLLGDGNGNVIGTYL